MEAKNKTLWVVETGVLLALLLVLQWGTKPLGTIVTGSAVNFLLIAATLFTGTWSGIIIGVVSPFLALLLGIVPLPLYFVPVVALGNAVLVFTYGLLLKRGAAQATGRKIILWAVTILVASLIKFAVLYAGVNWLVMPLVTAATGAAVKAPAAIFSTQQLLTAAIGGILALLIVPSVRHAIKGRAN